MSVWSLYRESREFVGPITVTVDGSLTTEWDVAIVPLGTRPTEPDWDTPDYLGADQGVLVGPTTSNDLPVGTYQIWVRYNAGTEMPVITAGTIRIR